MPNVVLNLELPAAVSEQPFSEKEIRCTAEMVYGEAGSEPFQGKVAAAAVAIRRSIAANWPTDLCGVVQEPNQFYGYRRFPDKVLEESLRSVRYAIDHLGDIPEAMYFHRKEIKGNYASQYTIGNHTFYMRGARRNGSARVSGGNVASLQPSIQRTAAGKEFAVERRLQRLH